MVFSLQHEYRLKFYLNAQHFFMDFKTGKKGETHPHTWEFCLNITIDRADFTPFYVFERGINDYLEKYQNKIMNECPPFDAILPTLESMTEQFAKDFYGIVEEQGGCLVRIEGSEGPTRSYLVTISRDDAVGSTAHSDEVLSRVIDDVLDGMMR